MRFLATSLLALAAVAAPVLGAPLKNWELDIDADNDFEVFISRAGDATATNPLDISGQVNVWQDASRFNVALAPGDVIAVYIHNWVNNNQVSGQPTTVNDNPSALVARLLETVSASSGAALLAGGADHRTYTNWKCLARHETNANANTHTGFDYTRLTGGPSDTTSNPTANPDGLDWARIGTNIDATSWNLLPDQTGDTMFQTAFPISAVNDPTNIWSKNSNGQIQTTMRVDALTDPNLVPWWIYTDDENQSGVNDVPVIAHHGWCRYTVPPQGDSGVNGDPIFSGFQGQTFQFHGLPDEVFNLISTPTLQVNSHFVYLSSGACTYNNTECYTHPGTYIDQLGFAFEGRQVQLAAGPHAQGLHLSINGDAITAKGTYKFAQTNGDEVRVTLKHHDVVLIETAEFSFKVVNSDNFFNMQTSLLDRSLLRVGAAKRVIADRHLCQREQTVDAVVTRNNNNNSTERSYGQVEATLQKMYGNVKVPVHGLLGQTWRNVKVCGKNWIGAVADYVASDLFATDYTFNFFTTA